MARRTNILSTILGGFGGGAEGGLAQRERSLAEQERRRVAQAAQRAEARQGQLDIAGLADRGYVTPAQQTASMRKAAPGLQEALGVASGMLGQGPRADNASRAFSGAGIKALESAAGQYGAPVADVTVGGQRMIRTETPMQEALREAEATSARAARDFEAQERTKAQFKAAEARESEQAAAAARTARLGALKGAGVPDEDAVLMVELEAKYGDVVPTPGVLATMRGQDIGAATTRRGQDLSAETTRARQEASGAGSGQTSAMQEMMLSRVQVAKQQSRSAHGEMEIFEEGLIDGSVKPITSTQATAAARAFGGTLDSKYWEGYLNKNRPDLAQYIRNAKAIGAAERLVMPRGGSNLLMNLETALAGVGPGASEPLIRTTQAFRRGLVEGLERETPEALLEAENARVESAIGTDAERRGEPPPGGAPRQFTDADREDRWDEIERQNPALSDDQITAQVRREMP